MPVRVLIPVVVVLFVICLLFLADRELRARCVAAGAVVVGPGWLLGLLGD